MSVAANDERPVHHDGGCVFSAATDATRVGFSPQRLPGASEDCSDGAARSGRP
jgi:hypothetical protein